MMTKETASDRLEAHVTGPRLDREKLLREARAVDEGLIERAKAFVIEQGGTGGHHNAANLVAELIAALTRPLGEGEETRDATGETVLGMRVAAWRWPVGKPEDVTQESWNSVFPSGAGNQYAEHWSTGPEGAERLFAERDVRAALSPPPVVEEAGLRSQNRRDMAAFNRLSPAQQTSLSRQAEAAGIAPTPTAGEEAVERLRKIERDHLAHLDGMIGELASQYNWDDQKKEAERANFRRCAAVSLNFSDFQAVIALASLPSPSGLTIPDELRTLSGKATPGKWEDWDFEVCGPRFHQQKPGNWIATTSGNDAPLIVGAVNFIRQALDQESGR